MVYSAGSEDDDDVGGGGEPAGGSSPSNDPSVVLPPQSTSSPRGAMPPIPVSMLTGWQTESNIFVRMALHRSLMHVQVSSRRARRPPPRQMIRRYTEADLVEPLSPRVRDAMNETHLFCVVERDV